MEIHVLSILVGAWSFLCIKLSMGEEVTKPTKHEVPKTKLLEEITVGGGLMSCILQRNRCVVNTHFYKPINLQSISNSDWQWGFHPFHKAGIFPFFMSLHWQTPFKWKIWSWNKPPVGSEIWCGAVEMFLGAGALLSSQQIFGQALCQCLLLHHQYRKIHLQKMVF